MSNARSPFAKAVFQAVRMTPSAIYVAIIALGLALCLGDVHLVGVPMMVVAAVCAAIAVALSDLPGNDGPADTVDE